MKKTLILIILVFCLAFCCSSIFGEGHTPSLEDTRGVIMGWLETLDASKYTTEDVVFLDMASGEPLATNNVELGENLYWFYNVAFEAQIVDPFVIIGEGRAVVEFTVSGVHIGEFAGIPGTGNKVHFPKIVTYELEEEYPYRIKNARFYIMMNILMDQIAGAD